MGGGGRKGAGRRRRLFTIYDGRFAIILSNAFIPEAGSCLPSFLPSPGKSVSRGKDTPALGKKVFLLLMLSGQHHSCGASDSGAPS